MSHIYHRHFIASDTPSARALAEFQDVEQWPRHNRVRLILGSSALLWAVIILTIVW
jgi:hypothetical protein